jgi:hypothetical protein
MVAVGFTTASLVYRGTFNTRTNTGGWSFMYMQGERENLVQPPFDLDYACRMALMRVQHFIDDYPT